MKNKVSLPLLVLKNNSQLFFDCNEFLTVDFIGSTCNNFKLRYTLIIITNIVIYHEYQVSMVSKKEGSI